ncbi:MupA/Atu3671 family FMN-dependent luciferase-like monooxygenase [Tahibacter sp.]|uniref:MupA/Atu3671 family FMN-dependent luciferase-like monooxygenase n=1 Tax=Tahibacter sp. TaxID=2056211 RepID=UPI0028C3F7E6|nr:MupA/Atu3671 family FMN-dependent luciferase-like monooxygenase [Tahibacter sp.]
MDNTNSLLSLLDRLKAEGVQISLAGDDRLKVNTQAESIAPGILAELKERKPEILAWLRKALRSSDDDGLPRKDTGSLTREVLTPMQQSLWLAYQFDPDSTAYNLPVLLSLDGQLDVELLARCLEALVRRHEALRTRFFVHDGLPYQGVSDTPFSLEIKEVAENALADAIDAQMDRRFDLERSPLFTCRLLRVSNERHVLCIAMHHIISDGWSCEVLLRELATLYSGRVATLPPMPFQYRDYSYWHRHEFEPAHKSRLTAFWRDYLDGAPGLLEMPADFSRPAQLTTAGAAHTFILPPSVVDVLRSNSRQIGCSVHHYLVSAFQWLMHRYSGQTDIVIGVPAANRARQEFQQLVGLFINLLPLRTQVRADQSFVEHVRTTIANLNRVLGHQELSLEQIVEILAPVRSLSYTPVFQHMFAYQEASPQALQLPGVAVAPISNRITTSKYDLVLTITDDGSALSGVVQYCTDLYRHESMVRFAENFVALLEQVSSEPQRRLSDARFAADSQLRMLAAVNDTVVPLPAQMRVHQYFERSVERHARLRALSFEGVTLTYAELNARANAIAHVLRAGQLGPGCLIGLCMERSLDMVASLLAIWKAGAAYVPLDPGYPLDRVHYMVEDAGLQAIVTTCAVAELLPEQCCGQVIALDSEDVAAAISRAPERNPDCESDPLAYVIYTSGSTGRPKGVKIAHDSVVNLIVALDQEFGHTVVTEAASQSTWLAVTSICFDISVLELFWTLSCGFHVVLQPEIPVPGESSGEIDFSLFYFAAEEANQDKYRLLLEGTRFADAAGLRGVWVPERHFHSFGDQFPNPAVAAAVVGAISERVRVRCGSVVLPLHDPVRVVEEWAMVDHFSRGRVEMSIASGWHPNDFIFQPDSYDDRHRIMRSHLEQVQKLWRGESIVRRNGLGKDVVLATHPSPVQRELPLWITAAGSPETFRYAGSIGAGVLTHFLGQDRYDLAAKIQVYRDALHDAGFPPERARVALMLHTFIADDSEFVAQTVRAPFKNYLRHSLGLVAPIAQELGLDLDAHREDVIEVAFERFFRHSGLFGTVSHCAGLVQELADAGVTEIACLIDFGVDHATTLAHLPKIAELRKVMKWHQAQRALLAKRHERRWQAEDLIVLHGVTHMQATPSYVRGWIHSAPGREALNRLQLLCVGGEALDRQLGNQLCKAVPGDVYNMYGPTETTVWSSFQRLDGQCVEIGGPTANTRFHVLDAYGHDCPIGVPGELHIGGRGLFLGYHRQDDLTRQKKGAFLAADRAGVVYRTGDLVRWTEGYRIEFLNRVDSQIKLRGFRIELGEIESVLLTHGAVVATAVVVREDVPGQKRLVGYIVGPVSASGLDRLERGAELTRWLQSTLPDYMIPEAFVFLDALPLTPNKKLDRAALPAPDVRPAAQVYAAPRTVIERKIHTVWQRLLGLDAKSFGIDDEFFRLGGNSLQAIQLASRLKQSLQVTVSIRDIFASQSIRALAGKIEKMDGLSLLPLQPLEDRPKTLRASYAQRLIWFVHFMPNVAKSSLTLANAAEFTGELDLGLLERSIQHVIDGHDCLRARFFLRGRSELVMHVDDSHPFQLVVVDCRHLSANEADATVQELIAQERSFVFDLAKGPLFRACAVQCAPRRHVLILSLHHIVGDAWAQSLVRQEISASYNSLKATGQFPVSQQSIHYRDFAYWSARWHQEDMLAGQLEFWRQKFDSLRGLRRFPTDFDNPLNCVGETGFLDLMLNQAQVDRLAATCTELRISVYTALLAAFKLSLYKLSGIAQQVISSFHLGRSRAELELSIGQYAEGFFIITQIDDQVGLLDFCAAVRDIVYEAQDNCDISGFYVRQRTGGELPVIPIVFNYFDMLRVDNWDIVDNEAKVISKPMQSTTTMVAMEADVRWTEIGLRAVLTYNRKLFMHETIERLRASFLRLVDAICDKDNSPICVALGATDATATGAGRPAREYA